MPTEDTGDGEQGTVPAPAQLSGTEMTAVSLNILSMGMWELGGSKGSHWLGFGGCR